MKQETRILVLSDTHGAKAPLRSLVLRERPDKIFHLGDNTGDALYLADLGLAPLIFVLLSDPSAHILVISHLWTSINWVLEFFYPFGSL